MFSQLLVAAILVPEHFFVNDLMVGKKVLVLCFPPCFITRDYVRCFFKGSLDMRKLSKKDSKARYFDNFNVNLEFLRKLMSTVYNIIREDIFITFPIGLKFQCAYINFRLLSTYAYKTDFKTSEEYP